MHRRTPVRSSLIVNDLALTSMLDFKSSEYCESCYPFGETIRMMEL
jgi:hypothetical protein